MIDAADDLRAALEDCGELAETAGGQLLGRFADEPTGLAVGEQVILSSEPVFLAARADIEAVELVRDASIELHNGTWYVKEIPKADSSSLVRIRLKR